MDEQHVDGHRSLVLACQNGDATINAGGSDWLQKVKDCRVFHPQPEEFADPLAYIKRLEPLVADDGICKIVPPDVTSSGAEAPVNYDPELSFTTLVQPAHISAWSQPGQPAYGEGTCYTVAEFQSKAAEEFEKRFGTGATVAPEAAEAGFWEQMTVTGGPDVECGMGVEGSAFTSSASNPNRLAESSWNFKVLPRLEKSILRLVANKIPGITCPVLDFGMLFSTTPWRVEEHYLYSIKYNHEGAAKTWYAVPGGAAPDFEATSNGVVFKSSIGPKAALELLLQKATLFSPQSLLERGVPVCRAVQRPGELIVTYPRAYHCGFSHGFNCIETIDFAMADWLPFGAASARRYRLLRHPPLLPYDELLCREALAVAHMELRRRAKKQQRKQLGLPLEDGQPDTPSLEDSPAWETRQAGHAGNGELGSLSDSSLPSTSNGTARDQALHKLSLGDAAAVSKGLERCVKVEFVRLMQFQHDMRSLLHIKGATPTAVPQEQADSVSCMLCSHSTCYAIIACNCFPGPICFHHPQEILSCYCGSNRRCLYSINLLDMEAVAVMFMDDATVAAAVAEASEVDDLWSLNGRSEDCSQLPRCPLTKPIPGYCSFSELAAAPSRPMPEDHDQKLAAGSRKRNRQTGPAGRRAHVNEEPDQSLDTAEPFLLQGVAKRRSKTMRGGRVLQAGSPKGKARLKTLPAPGKRKPGRPPGSKTGAGGARICAACGTTESERWFRPRGQEGPLCLSCKGADLPEESARSDLGSPESPRSVLRGKRGAKGRGLRRGGRRGYGTDEMASPEEDTLAIVPQGKKGRRKYVTIDKQCTREGCHKRANTTGFCTNHTPCRVKGCGKSGYPPTWLCIRHGGGIRCQFDGCDRGSRGTSGLCKNHGGGKRCKVKGCNTAAQDPTEFCCRHGGGTRCAVDGCDKSAQGGTAYCKKHGGGRKCSLPGCKVSVYKGGFCKAHQPEKLRKLVGST